jgi:hypothetical protein
VSLNAFCSFVGSRTTCIPSSHQTGAWLTTCANHACSNKLLDLASDTWIAHVIVESGRITLGLLKDGLHDGI